LVYPIIISNGIEIRKPLTQKKTTRPNPDIFIRNEAGVPPENLLEITSHTNQGLVFSPNLSKLISGKELKVGKFLFYFILRFLYSDEPWIPTVEVFEFMTRLVKPHWHIRVDGRSLGKILKSQRRKTLQMYFEILLKETPVGWEPKEYERKALLEIFNNLGISSTFLYRSWGGMTKDYSAIFSELQIRLSRPEKPTRPNRRRRSSEDSRGSTSVSVWREGILDAREVNPPEVEIVSDQKLFEYYERLWTNPDFYQGDILPLDTG